MGYYYDDEIGLYYLRSRYYDPATGRFLNADGQLNGDILGYNLYAYCGNNPVMNIDPSGEAWEHWIAGAAIVRFAIGTGMSTEFNARYSGNVYFDNLPTWRP